MLKQTPKTRVLFVRRLTPVILVVFGVFYVSLTLLHAPKTAYAAASSTINFQARLQTKAGGIVPDGDYNVEFKLYDASSSTGGTRGSCGADAHCLWVETRTDGNVVEVRNGYLTVSLGSVTAFGSNIDWTQNLWLTMNIGGTGGTPSWDGEMNPRLPLTAIPYAFTAGQLQTTNGSNTSKLSIQGSNNHGNQTFVIQDQGAAGTYDLLTQNEADSSYIKLSSVSPQDGDINISGTATSDSVETNSIDTTSAGPLAIGGTNASTISIGSSGGNATTTINGSAVVKSTSGNDSATAFQVQSSGGGTAVLDVDTTNNRVGINISDPSRTLDINTTDDTGSAPPVLLNQQGTGDADIELKTPNQSFYMGVDSSDNSTFKISSSAANGALFTMGLTTQGANLDSGSGGYIICQPMIPDIGGTVTGVSVEYGPPLDSVNNKFRLALFGDTLGLPSTTPIAESGEGTISAGWNNIGLSASVTAGTQYWLCVQSNTADNSKNNLYYNTGAANNVKFLPQTYPSWPTSGWSNGGAVNFSLYATIAPASAGDSFAASLFSLTNTGAATFQNSVNSTQALQVQNASGTNTVLNVDTTNGRIGIDTSAPTADLTFGGGAARTIAIATAPADSDGSQLTIQAGNGNGTNKNGGNLLLQAGNSTGSGTAGSVIVRSQTNAVNAFQVQSATTQTLLNVDTTNALAVSIGSDSSVVGTTTVGASPNSGGQNGIITRRITTSAAGTLNGISFYINGIDGNSNNDNFQVAVYSDSSSCAASVASCPGTLIASSTTGTLNGFAWNTRNLSATLSASTNYWIAIEQNASSDAANNTVTASTTGDHYSFYKGGTVCTGGTVGYGIWPTTLGASCTPLSNNASTVNLSAYATINTGSDGYAISTDNNAHVGIGTAANSTDMLAINGVATNSALNVTGYTTISADSKRAFAIQNAAGSVTDFEVDTNNQKVYVNSSFGGTNAASFNIHGAGASSIDMLDIYNNSNIAVLQVNKDGTTTFGSSSARAGIGTVTNAANSATVTAGTTATLFTSQLKVGDTLTLDPSGTPATCVVLSIASDTSLTCTSNIASAHNSPGVGFNFTGAGSSDITSVQANGNIKFGGGNAHSIYVDTAISGSNGDNLTIQAGSGNGTNKNGGNLVLQGGNGTGTGTAGSVIVKSQTNSATAFQVQNSSSATIFTVDTTTSEKVTIGPSGGDTTGAILVLGIKTNSGDPTTEVDGAMYYNSNMGSFRCGQGGVWQSCIGGLLTASTAIASTVANTSTETAFSPSYTLPANYCSNGRILRVTAYGTYQDNHSPGPNLVVYRLKLGSTVIAATDGDNLSNLISNAEGWSLTLTVMCPNAAGTSATVTSQGLLTNGANNNIPSTYTTHTVATNASSALTLTAQWNNADSANTTTLQSFIVEGVGQ